MSDDAGLFGPESVTWRVHGDPVLLVGGLRALFLQALHPLAMAGVADHSGYRADPWGRLRRTAEYVGVTTFGTRAQAVAATARVRRAHRGLRGVEPESGQHYAVADPHLLHWVHCCEVDSFLTTALRSGLRISAADQDRYVTEQMVLGRLVGVPDRLLPRTTADLAGYFREIRPELRATAEARRAARFLLNPPMPAATRWLTPAPLAWGALAGLSLAALPRWARRLYGLPGLPLTDLGATTATRALRTALRLLPPHLRTGPHQRAAQDRRTA